MSKSGRINKNTVRKLTGGILIAVLWLALWQAASMRTIDLLIPSPPTVLRAFFELCGEKDFAKSVIFSLLRIMAGWLSGILCGTLLAVLTAYSKALRMFFSPALHIVKATPVASFILLALVWLSSSRVPVFTAFLIVLPSVWTNVSEGILSTDRKLAEASRVFRMTGAKKLVNLYIPAVLPYFAAASKAALGLAWKAGISAEVLCTPVGSIGRGIYRAKLYLETPRLFAWTLTVIVLSMIIEKLFGVLLGRRAKSE